jgi:hypothetical protein
VDGLHIGEVGEVGDVGEVGVSRANSYPHQGVRFHLAVKIVYSDSCSATKSCMHGDFAMNLR